MYDKMKTRVYLEKHLRSKHLNKDTLQSTYEVRDYFTNHYQCVGEKRC